MFPQFEHLTDLALLFLRFMVGLVFLDSGYQDLKDPDARAKSIEMSRIFAVFLGAAEAAGGVAVILGILTQLAAIGLILVMLGAVQKKIVVWKTGFWGKDGLGWNYELLLISMLFVVLATGGGAYTLWR